MEPAVAPEFNPEHAMAAWMQAIAPYGIFTTDKALRIRSWNDWLATQSGRDADQLIGQPLLEAFPEIATRHLDRHFRMVLNGEVIVLSTALHKYLLSFPTPVADATQPCMLQTVRIAPLSERGEIVGTITVIEDVTQREIQASLLQRQQELERLLSSALALLLQSRDPSGEMPGIFSLIAPVMGLDSYLSYLLDASGENLVLHAAGGVSPKARESVQRLALSNFDQTALHSASAPANLNVANLHETLKRAGLRASSAFPLLVSDRLLGLIVFATFQRDSLPSSDISILSRFARYIALALDRTQREREIIEASRAKDDFLAALSHELRTPLNPVLLLASESKDYPDFPAEAREAFRIIEKNVQLEARLIDDLLDITRIEHGKLTLEMQLVDLHLVIQDAVETVKAEVARQHLTLVLELVAAEHTVMGDPGRLQQVLWNVIKNAVKFTPAGGTVSVATRVDPVKHELVMTVTDTGIGMDAKELSRIFTAFSQGDHAGTAAGHKFGGLGLGLAISRRLVEAHRGRIEASSPGKQQGSSFTIALPIVTSALRRPSPKAPARPASAHFSFPAGTEARILVVEDHDASRATLAALLKRRGFEVITAESAEKALELADRESFHLVISDIGLPDMDGISLMKTLREKYGLVGIALTGYGMEDDLTRTAEAGFLAHLTKPISVDSLNRALLKAFPAE